MDRLFLVLNDRHQPLLALTAPDPATALVQQQALTGASAPTLVDVTDTMSGVLSRIVQLARLRVEQGERAGHRHPTTTDVLAAYYGAPVACPCLWCGHDLPHDHPPDAGSS